MGLIYFRKLESHKRSVITIYRELLRHLTHLDQINPVSSIKNAPFLKQVKDEFKINKGLVSPNRVRIKLNQSYELDQALREIYHYPHDRLIRLTQLQTLINKYTTTPNAKTGPKINRNRFGLPVKRDMNNLQDLESQQVQNYVNRYIKFKQRTGELPSIISPLIIKEIITPEALQQRAKLDLVRTQRLIAKGPYRAKVVKTSSGMSFVRGPFRQSDKVGRCIGLKVRKEQNFINLLQSYEQTKHFYAWEDTYNAHLCEVFENLEDEGKWGSDVEQVIEMQRDEITRSKTWMKTYQRQKLPLILRNFQIKADAIFRKKARRWESMSLEVKKLEDSPFNELIGEEKLWDIVKRYGFSSQRKQ